MTERRQRTQNAGIANQNVELAPALEDRRAQPVDGVEIGQIERNERGFAADLADLVIDFLQAAHSAGDQDRVRAFSGKGQCDRAANATGGACDHREAVC